MHYEKFSDGTVKCIQDVIPFELPQRWAWTRLGNLSSSIQYGLSNSAEAQGTHRLLRITDIQDGKVNWEDVPFTTVDNAGTYLLRKYDIVFARTGATVGKSFLINDLPFESVYASYLIRIRLFDCISPSYLYQFFNSHCYWEQITGKSVGVGQPNCNGTSLKELFIPLPPLNEQKRIVPAANSLLDYASVIELEKASLQEIINLTKSKILDLAIRGKLVPQNPDDEPASVLLERIRAEKEELIKQGKIKRDKKESVIFKGEDNSYYEKIGDRVSVYDADELPLNWGIGSFSQLNMYAIENINPSNYLDEMFELYSVPNFDIGMPEIVSGKEIGATKQAICENDLLVCKINPRINRVWITGHITTYRLLGSSEWIVFRNRFIFAPYLQYFFSSTYFRELLLSNVSGVGGSLMRAQPESVKKYPILIPPYKEQIKISEMIGGIFMVFTEIEESLS